MFTLRCLQHCCSRQVVCQTRFWQLNSVELYGTECQMPGHRKKYICKKSKDTHRRGSRHRESRRITSGGAVADEDQKQAHVGGHESSGRWWFMFSCSSLVKIQATRGVVGRQQTLGSGVL